MIENSPKDTHNKWTDDQDMTCRKMARSCSASIIGKAIGKTRNAVIGYCRRNGIPLGDYFNMRRWKVPIPKTGRRNKIEAVIGVGGLEAKITPVGAKLGDCKWIIGDPRGGHKVCGLPAMGSFCPNHARIVYRS